MQQHFQWRKADQSSRGSSTEPLRWVCFLSTSLEFPLQVQWICDQGKCVRLRPVNDLLLHTRSLIHTTFVLTSKPNKKLMRLPCIESSQWNLSLIAKSCSDMIISTYSNRWNLLSADTTLLRLYPQCRLPAFPLFTFWFYHSWPLWKTQHIYHAYYVSYYSSYSIVLRK